jgi:hypothetical protein
MKNERLIPVLTYKPVNIMKIYTLGRNSSLLLLLLGK